MASAVTPLTLQQFEQIDGLHSQLRYMGDFETCSNPRGFIRLQNRLFDACVDAGMPFDTDDHEEWAVVAITHALVSA
jgi:hypothetical protein